MTLVRFHRPSAGELEQLRAGLVGSDFSFRPGILAGPAPPGFQENNHRHDLGSGSEAWERAKAAIAEWSQFDVGWAGIATGGQPPHPGQIVIVHAGWFGLSFLAPCRVIETYDRDAGESAAFGLVYGTLPRHVAVGEERFEVTLDKATGAVAYRLHAMARYVGDEDPR